MAVMYDLRTWLDQGNAPSNAEDASDLERAMQGDSRGLYQAKSTDAGKFVLVTGPGREAFMFPQTQLAAHLTILRAIYASEPGASLDGDVAFERGMAKGD